jgi:hypothetical protein
MAVKQIKKTKKQKQLPVPKVESIVQKSLIEVGKQKDVSTQVEEKSETVHHATQNTNPSNIIVIDGITHY